MTLSNEHETGSPLVDVIARAFAPSIWDDDDPRLDGLRNVYRSNARAALAAIVDSEGFTWEYRHESEDNDGARHWFPGPGPGSSWDPRKTPLLKVERRMVTAWKQVRP